MIGSTRMTMANFLPALLLALLLSACSSSQMRPGAVYDSISGELKQAGAARSAAERPEAVDKALLPPLQAELPKAATAETRFDLVVNNAPANQVFMALVSGTRYSMLVNPEVAGTITVNLKDATVKEALDTIRELYGYEYKMKGSRIFIQPLAMQSRVFQINYLAGRRQGQTDTRVTSGSISSVQGTTPGTTPGTATPGATPAPGAPGTPGSGASLNSSRIYTTSDADFWNDLDKALQTIVGKEGGRQVILNSLSGVIVVKALPKELREVENFLRATQVMVERQVMIEAKIVRVELKDGYQSGVNWSLFGRGNDANWNLGPLGPSTLLKPGSGNPLTSADINSGSGDALLSTTPGSSITGGSALAAGLFGLAFQTRNFAALLSFLETQGAVQVLSSPRIATINNQKAVLKVGTDDFFVTSVTPTTTTTVNTTSTVNPPTVTLQPFFSGIALDVTPQIDDENSVILHIHPSVSQVTEKTKIIDLGISGSTMKLPLASSTVSETDSIVRVQDSNIVAIGGLMQQQQSNDRAGLPGAGSNPLFSAIFGNENRSAYKSELVILLKPTIIQGDRNWQKDLQDLQERFPQYDPRPPVTVTPAAP